MRARLWLTGIVLATAVAGLDCSHVRNRPCPPKRPYAASPPAAAPRDAATVAGVAAAGARYQTCAQPHQYLISRVGAREMTGPELHATKRTLYLALQGRGGQSAGIGGCGCTPGAPPQLCIVLELRATRPSSPAFVAGELARILAANQLEGVAAGVVVTLLSPPGPRCAADDPACTPVPYSGQCAERTDYDPDDCRQPVWGAGDDACAHDGECSPGGCGNSCESTSRPPLPGTCQAYPALEHAWCGCVQGRCAWFTQ